MKRQGKWVFYLAMAPIFSAAVTAGWLRLSQAAAAAETKTLPRSVVIATHAVGSGFHADGSAVAKMVSERAPMTMVVRPHPGPLQRGAQYRWRDRWAAFCRDRVAR